MKKIGLNFFSLYDYTAIEKHLERQARKGWELERAGVFFHYRKSEPQNLTYSVHYNPNNGYFAPVSQEEEILDDYSRAAGWEHVGNLRSLNIYLNRNKNPLPLDTDPAIRLDSIETSVTLPLLSGGGVMLIFLLFWISGFSYLRNNPLEIFGSPGALAGALLCVGVPLFLCLDMIIYACWHRKAKRRAQLGAFTSSPCHSRWLLLILYLTMLLMYLNFVFSRTRLGTLYAIALPLLVLGELIYDILRPRLREKKVPGGLNYLVHYLIVLPAFLLPSLFNHVTSVDTAADRQGAYFTPAAIFEDQESTRTLLPESLIEKNGITGMSWSSHSSCFYSYMYSYIWSEAEDRNSSETTETQKPLTVTAVKPSVPVFYNLTEDLLERQARLHPENGSCSRIIRLEDRLILIQSAEPLSEEEITYLSESVGSL